ncbi:hypothetical protein Avbf_07736 [Armadillidium vulgare]|nr:hypothetical protein Avbf_07736 [Armadillidium vulgare]
MLVFNPKRKTIFNEELKPPRAKMTKEDKKEPFLTNLGRATMRGLRKCKKCGTLNGTRGYSCKNKHCDVVFKEAGEKKKASTEPCKIHTGTAAQIFSVRVRDKGPDYRSFVQLATNMSNNNAHSVIINNGFQSQEIFLDGTKCFVESCQKIQKYSIAVTCKDTTASLCNHIKAAANCYKGAQPLSFKNSVLNTFPIPSEFKDEMYQLATNTCGPLVQRVSKGLFVVKCKPDSTHPLGFLHFSITQTKNKKEGDYKFFCSCKVFKLQPLNTDTYRKCVHLYACVIVFASDERLSSEFGHFIDLIRNEKRVKNLQMSLVVQKEEADSEVEIDEPPDSLDVESRNAEDNVGDVSESSFFILNDSSTGTPCQVEVEVVGSDSDLMDLPISNSDTVCTEGEEELHLHTSDGGTIAVHQISENIPLPSLKRKTDESIVDSKRLQSGVSPKREPVDESEVNLSFTSWIASVTERINQSLHYGFSGKPDPLVFHLPKMFFDCFMNRINKTIGSKKRKSIQEAQTFIRKDAVPLGKFTKYTWKLTSLSHVKEIFSNSEIPLQITRYFSLQKDGSYKPCRVPETAADNDINSQAGTQPIKPREYKTVLKVGISCPNISRETTPFVIEWIPDILPLSEIGELRFRFEFDHYCNGQLVFSNL